MKESAVPPELMASLPDAAAMLKVVDYIHTQLDLDWPEPLGWLNKQDTRKQAIREFEAAIFPVVEAAWSADLPKNQWPSARRQVGRGIRSAVSRTTEYSQLRNLASAVAIPGLDGIAYYWEPAEASLPADHLSPENLQAYRWIAALVAGAVRNALEELHGKYTSDASMESLNKGVRNVALDVLLRNSWVAYRMGRELRLMIACRAFGLPVDIPSAAGQ